MKSPFIPKAQQAGLDAVFSACALDTEHVDTAQAMLLGAFAHGISALDAALVCAACGCPSLLKLSLATLRRSDVGTAPYAAWEDSRLAELLAEGSFGLARAALAGGNPECARLCCAFGADPFAPLGAPTNPRSRPSTSWEISPRDHSGAYPWECAFELLTHAKPSPAIATSLAETLCIKASQMFSSSFEPPTLSTQKLAWSVLSRLAQLGADFSRPPLSNILSSSFNLVDQKPRSMATELLAQSVYQASHSRSSDPYDFSHLLEFCKAVDPHAQLERAGALFWLAHSQWPAPSTFEPRWVAPARQMVISLLAELGPEQPAALAILQQTECLADLFEVQSGTLHGTRIFLDLDGSSDFLAPFAPHWQPPDAAAMSLCRRAMAQSVFGTARLFYYATKHDPASGWESNPQSWVDFATSDRVHEIQPRQLIACEQALRAIRLAALTHPQLDEFFYACVQTSSAWMAPESAEHMVSVLDSMLLSAGIDQAPLRSLPGLRL